MRNNDLKQRESKAEQEEEIRSLLLRLLELVATAIADRLHRRDSSDFRTDGTGALGDSAGGGHEVH
jgi:hypothetical protein